MTFAVDANLLGTLNGSSLTSSLVGASFGVQNSGSTSSLNSLLQSSSTTFISPNLEFTQDGAEQSLASILSSSQRLDSNFNLLSSLGGFENYATTLNLLEASNSNLQGQFNNLDLEV